MLSPITKTVGFADWDISFLNRAKLGPSYEPQNRMSWLGLRVPGNCSLVLAAMAFVARSGGTQRRDIDPSSPGGF